MKRILIITVSLLAIAGCNNPAPADQTAQAMPAPAAASPADANSNAEACAQVPGYNPFPQGAVPTFPYHLRSDRLYVHANGKNRRRVAIEFLDGDANAALASYRQNLTAAGFKARAGKDGPEGRTTTPFTKKGFGTLIVTAVPSPGANPANPAAKGVLVIDYPMDATAPTEAKAPPSGG